eukprot:4671307-Amphidinium_carterae.1
MGSRLIGEAGGYGMCCLHTTKADLYNRLWCVHEMDVASANPFVEAPLGSCPFYPHPQLWN